MTATGLAISLVLVTGTILLFVGSAWAGVIVVGVGMAMVLYSVAVPQISWRMVNSALGALQPVNGQTAYKPVPRARVTAPARGAFPPNPREREPGD